MKLENYTGVRDRVSVVTPVYNGARHLPRLLRSILAQTWDHIEMILVDDGSQDKTVETARAFQGRFRARGFSLQIIQAEHQNASAAINRGLPLVTGEFLVWPDSDDELEPDSIRKRVEFLRANPQYRCVRSLSRYRFEDGTPAPRQEPLGNLEDENLFFPVLTGRSFVCCGCYMLCLETFFSIYPRRQIPAYDVGQNFQMLLPFLYVHPCPTLREELYTVYVRPESHSRRALTPQEDEDRCAGFEDLVDELVSLCGIRGSRELLQVKRWKWNRRYALYRRCNRRWKAAIAYCRLLWYRIRVI